MHGPTLAKILFFELNFLNFLTVFSIIPDDAPFQPAWIQAII